MFCRHCGHEVQEGQSFCSICGADLRENERFNTGRGASRAYPVDRKTKKTSTKELGLKIFAVVCAVLYGVRAVANLYAGIQDLGYCLFGGRINYLVGFLDSLFGALFSLMFAVVYGWMCVVLILIAVRQDKNNEKMFFFSLLGGGAAAIILVVLRLMENVLDSLLEGWSIIFFDWNGTFFVPVLGNAVAVGGILLILSLMGRVPLQWKGANKLEDGMDAAQDSSNTQEDSYESFEEATVDASGQNNFRYRQTNDTRDYPTGTVDMGAMKTDRSLVAYILLSLITCGIYGYYFLYALARDTNVVCNGDGGKTCGLLKLILFSIITCGIYPIYWYYSLGNRLASNAPRYGLHFQENGTTVLLWHVIGFLLCGIGPFVAMHILIKNINALCVAYNREKGLYGN